jgi:glyoxylase-like metal-dependent hydrolase (beta-lactamase superfamily II)
MSPLSTFAVFESFGGAKIQRIPLEVFPNFYAYVYLVQKDPYCVLIDAGSGTETSHENLLSGFQQAGVQPSDLTHILLTHGDIDHFGGLSKLRPLTNARVGVHELDVQIVAHHEASLELTGRRLDFFLAETGLAQEARDQILSMSRFSKTIYRSGPVDFTYEAIGMRLGPFELIHLPGHSPGHVAVRIDDVIFCGDMVVEGVTPHLSPESIHPFSGLDHFLKSLSRFQDWAKDSRLILNGHNDALADLPSQIELTRQNILRRMSKAVEPLQEPLTIREVCQAVYGEINGFNQLLVIEKTGAYVEYLYSHGMITISNPEEMEQGGIARYRRLRDGQTILAELEKRVGRYTSMHVHT